MSTAITHTFSKKFLHDPITGIGSASILDVIAVFIATFISSLQASTSILSLSFDRITSNLLPLLVLSILISGILNLILIIS